MAFSCFLYMADEGVLLLSLYGRRRRSIDRVEDRQLNSNRVQSAMASTGASCKADPNAKKLREKELDSVKINAADVELKDKGKNVGASLVSKLLMRNKTQTW